jgi:hypothetical protein
MIKIQREPWDVACVIERSGQEIYLNAEGMVVVEDESRGPSMTFVDNNLDAKDMQTDIKITYQGRCWIVPRTASEAWTFLTTERQSVSLRHFGKQLAIFKLSPVPDRSDPLAPDHSDDTKGALNIMPVSSGVWYISGTRVFQVEGDEHDIAVQSPAYLRLYSLDSKAIRWEKFSPSNKAMFNHNKIFCLVDNYVVIQYGMYHLLKRSNGHTYGKFDMPVDLFESFNRNGRFGPIVSKNGVIIRKPSANILYVFQITPKEVKYRIWQSEKTIEGFLVLRGSLDSLQLQLISDSSPIQECRSITMTINKLRFRKALMEYF